MLKVFINEHLSGSASLLEVMFSPAFQNQVQLLAGCIFTYHPTVMTSPSYYFTILRLLQHDQQFDACHCH